MFCPLNSSVTMQQQAGVVFHNVGPMYFPEMRVECHYSLTSAHPWSSNDWIGLFQVTDARSSFKRVVCCCMNAERSEPCGCLQVGWSSVKDYRTYAWALVPEGHVVGAEVNCCALFHGNVFLGGFFS